MAFRTPHQWLNPKIPPPPAVPCMKAKCKARAELSPVTLLRRFLWRIRWLNWKFLNNATVGKTPSFSVSCGKPLGTPTKIIYIYNICIYIYNICIYIYTIYVYIYKFFFDVFFLLLKVSCFICLYTRSFHRYSEKKMDWSAANMRLYQRSTHRYLTRLLWLGVMEMLGVSIYTNLFICISPIFNTS